MRVRRHRGTRVRKDRLQGLALWIGMGLGWSDQLM